MNIFCGPAAISDNVNIEWPVKQVVKRCNSINCRLFGEKETSSYCSGCGGGTIKPHLYCPGCGQILEIFERTINGKKHMSEILVDLEDKHNMERNHLMDMFYIEEQVLHIYFIPNKRYEKRSFNLDDALIYDQYVDISKINFKEEIDYFEEFYKKELKAISEVFSIEIKWIIKNI